MITRAGNDGPRTRRGSRFHCARSTSSRSNSDMRPRSSCRRVLATFGYPLTEEPFGPEDEDDDQDREDDRLGPVASRRRPAEAVVDPLDHRDRESAQHGARQVPDPADDRSRERDQAEAEALVVTDVRDVERIE